MRKLARSEKTQSTKGRLNKHNWWLLIVLPAWTYAAFWMAQLVVLGLVWVLSRVGVPLGSVNEVLLNATGSVVATILSSTKEKKTALAKVWAWYATAMYWAWYNTCLVITRLYCLLCRQK